MSGSLKEMVQIREFITAIAQNISDLEGDGNVHVFREIHFMHDYAWLCAFLNVLHDFFLFYAIFLKVGLRIFWLLFRNFACFHMQVYEYFHVFSNLRLNISWKERILPEKTGRYMERLKLSVSFYNIF